MPQAPSMNTAWAGVSTSGAPRRATAPPRLDPQVTGHFAAGHRHVVVLEIPAHHDEPRRADQLVPAAHVRSPLHRAGEPPVLQGDRHAEPARVDGRVGEGGEGRLLARVHVGAGQHDQPGAHAADVRSADAGRDRRWSTCHRFRGRRAGRGARPGGPGSGARCRPRCSRPGPPRAARPGAGKWSAWSPGTPRRSPRPTAHGPRSGPGSRAGRARSGPPAPSGYPRTFRLPVPAKLYACGLFGS